MEDFSGVKIALILGDNVAVILRDNKQDIPHPNMWELPGGAREDDETPEQCISREVSEELGLDLDLNTVVWQSRFRTAKGETGIFMVAPITPEAVSSIVLGDEGQDWKMMAISEFTTSIQAIPTHQEQLVQYLATAVMY